MKQITQGTGGKSQTTPPTETPKGLALVPKISNPYEERKLKVAAMQRKVMNVQKLEHVQNHLLNFEVGTDEDDGQTLSIRDKQRQSFETANPYIITKVIECIKSECANKIPQLQNELLAATI